MLYHYCGVKGCLRTSSIRFDQKKWVRIGYVGSKCHRVTLLQGYRLDDALGWELRRALALLTDIESPIDHNLPKNGGGD